jgi:hypothetical protein
VCYVCGMRIERESRSGEPLGITVAERLRVGQVGVESVTFGLIRFAAPDTHRGAQLGGRASSGEVKATSHGNSVGP